MNVVEYDFLFSLGRFTTRRRGGGQKHSQHRHRPLRVLPLGRVGHFGSAGHQERGVLLAAGRTHTHRHVVINKVLKHALCSQAIWGAQK